jgi:hypothetical protein
LSYQIWEEIPTISLFELKWLAVAILMLLGCCYAALSWKRRMAGQRTLARVKQQFNGVPVQALSPKAYFCGMDRRWDSQWRGHGVLILTADMLYFRSWNKNVDLSVPIDRIAEAEVCRNTRGLKTWRRRCLKVTYRGMDDHPRAATWLAQKPTDWVRLITENQTERSSDEQWAQEKHLSENENAGAGA